MTEALVKPGRPYHCGQMSRMLREEHRDLLLKMNVPVHRDLTAAFEDSSWSRAFFLDHELVALGGVTGPAMASDGALWLALSQGGIKHWSHIAREALRQIEELMETKRHLVTIVLKEDMPAIRFAYFVGFGDAMTIDINGVRAMKMTLSRKVH